MHLNEGTILEIKKAKGSKAAREVLGGYPEIIPRTQLGLFIDNKINTPSNLKYDHYMLVVGGDGMKARKFIAQDIHRVICKKEGITGKTMEMIADEKGWTVLRYEESLLSNCHVTVCDEFMLLRQAKGTTY